MSRIARIGVSVGIVSAITFVYFRVIHVNSTTVALTLLLAVLGIAARWGLLESVIASIVGMLCFTSTFCPRRAVTIADPENWVALFAFVVTAAVASQLSASVKKRAAEATHRQHEMEKLYELSRSLMLMDAQSACWRTDRETRRRRFRVRAGDPFRPVTDEEHRWVQVGAQVPSHYVANGRRGDRRNRVAGRIGVGNRAPCDRASGCVSDRSGAHAGSSKPRRGGPAK